MKTLVGVLQRPGASTKALMRDYVVILGVQGLGIREAIRHTVWPWQGKLRRVSNPLHTPQTPD